MKVFVREYKEWGIAQNYTVVTFTEFVASLIKDGKLSPKKSEYVFTPQDSPLLARDLEETQPLRDILSACGEVSEMLLNKSYTMLAGNFIMAEYLPDVMKKTAECRWTNAVNVNAKTVVTASTAEYNALLEVKPENIELLKLEEAMIKCL